MELIEPTLKICRTYFFFTPMLVKPAENQFSLYCTKNARLQALVFASADVFFDMCCTHT